MKSNFLLYILILSSLWVLLVFGFILAYFFSDTGLVIFALIGISWMLIAAGLMGPKRLKTRMREFQIWSRTKAVIFFPVHPHQAIDEALKGGIKEFVPTKERIKNFLILTIITLIFSVVLIIVGFFAWQQLGTPKSVACTQAAKICPDGSAVGRTGPNCEFTACPIDETADWQTYEDDKYGFTMKYPTEFFLTQPLQPQSKIISCDYVNFVNKCSVERTTINNLPFCLQKTSEGAAGTTYTTYSYTTTRNKECFVVSFTMSYPNCMNYLPIESQEMQMAYNKCRLDNEVNKPAVIDKMLSTFKFLK